MAFTSRVSGTFVEVWTVTASNLRVTQMVLEVISQTAAAGSSGNRRTIMMFSD